MKRVVSFLVYLLFALTALFPVGTLAASCFGYRFQLISLPAFAVTIAVLSVCVAVLRFMIRGDRDHKAVGILLAILAPVSWINAALYIFACKQILVIASVFICAGCCFLLAMVYGRPLSLKILAAVLSGLMIMPVGFLGFMAWVIGDFGQTTVVQTVESPSGTYYAEVIDSDQGALGGDTLVNVYTRFKLNAILFTVEKKPQCVYTGNWGEFNDMQIYWKDDCCLIINSVEYEIQ